VADAEWDMLVEESSVEEEWGSDADEPRHCLPGAWDDYSDDASCTSRTASPEALRRALTA